MILALSGWLLLANIVTWELFGGDKRRALHGERRIAEATLLQWALLGGTPAAYAARRRFRHKTRKQPFGQRLDLIAMVQAGVALGLAIALAG